MVWMVGVVDQGWYSQRKTSNHDGIWRKRVGWGGGNQIAAEAGLFLDPAHFCKFSDSDLATVSINWLRRG